MVGVSDLFWLYQNSGPLLLFLLLAGGTYVWRHDLQPRLKALEETQEARADKWESQQLNAQERAILLDDAHDRTDQIEQAVQRLKRRVRGLEQEYAADAGRPPAGAPGGRGSGGSYHDDSRDDDTDRRGDPSDRMENTTHDRDGGHNTDTDTDIDRDDGRDHPGYTTRG